MDEYINYELDKIFVHIDDPLHAAMDNVGTDQSSTVQQLCEPSYVLKWLVSSSQKLFTVYFVLSSFILTRFLLL